MAEPNPRAEYGQNASNKRKAKAQPQQAPQTNQTGQASIVSGYNLLLHSHDAQKNADGTFEWVKQDGWVRAPRDNDLLRLQFVYGFASLRNYWFINNSNNRLLIRLTTLKGDGNPVGSFGPMRLRCGSYTSSHALNIEMQTALDLAVRTALNAMNNWAVTGGANASAYGIFDMHGHVQAGDAVGPSGAHRSNVLTVLQVADGSSYARTEAGETVYPHSLLQLDPNEAGGSDPIGHAFERHRDNYYNTVSGNVPHPREAYKRMPSNEYTFTHAYRPLLDEDVLDEPTNWRTAELDQVKGRSNRAMFIVAVDLSKPDPNDRTYRLSCLPINEPDRVAGIPDNKLGFRRDAGFNVEFFGSNDSPHGPQVWGAYGSPDLYFNEHEFYVGTAEPYINNAFAQSKYAGASVTGNTALKEQGKSISGRSAYILDHYVKRNKRIDQQSAFIGYEASAVGYSPMATMLGSEGNNHILVRISQVNGKNIMTPYMSAGFDARVRETSRSAHPSDVLGVMHTTPEGDRAEASFSDSSGAEHSNSWFMTLSDNIIQRIRISLTDTANNDIASFTSNNRRMKAGDGVPFMVTLRADVIRNVDNERNQSQQTARGVTYTSPHRFLTDTSVEGTNEAPYTNKPVF
jgi:hypothetical protein